MTDFAFTGLSGNTQISTGGLQVIDELLTNVAKQFRPDGYIYDEIVAPQQVNYNIGLYPVFDKAAFFTSGGNLQVADDAKTPIIDFNWSTEHYHCVDYRLQTRITRKEMVQANPVLRLDYSKTVGLLSVFATNRETRLAAKLRATANGGQFTAAPIVPTVKWDQGTASTPATIQADIQQAILTVRNATGRRPNTLVIDYEVALAIANDFTLKDLIKYQIGPRVVSEGLPAVLPPTLFGLRVVIADLVSNTAGPGQTAALSGLWGNSARVMYVDPNAQWGVPSTVYSFRGRVTEGSTQAPSAVMPSGDAGSEPGPAGSWAIVDRWFDYDPPGEHIRAWECVDEKVVAPELGVELAPVLSSF